MKRLAAIVAVLLLTGIVPIAGNCVKQHSCCHPQKTDCCKVQAAPHNDATPTTPTVVIAHVEVTSTIDAPVVTFESVSAHASPPTQRRLATLSVLLI